jgi:hypothetical protein
MLALTARWADRWNSVWYGLPTDEFRAERGRLEQACREAGRDPAEIEVSAGIEIVEPTTAEHNGPESVVCRRADIADALRAWQTEGVTEVMCRLANPTIGGGDEIAAAVEMLRAG